MRLKKKSKGFQKDWIVRAYGMDGVSIISKWEIHDRYEWEASREAEADIEKLGRKCSDWTMMPI